MQSVSDEIVSDYNMMTLSRWFMRLGMELTAADKEAELVSQQNISEVTF